MSDLHEIIKSKEKRICAAQKSIKFFAIYYCTHYLRAAFAPFHDEMFRQLEFKNFRFLLWILFRESAKTTLARIKILHAICFRRKRNVKWIGYDEVKAKKNIRAVANELQGNAKIIEDFGQLYFDDSLKKGKMRKAKSLRHFQTANGVAVSTGTTRISTRGELDDENRPDFIVLDDIENNETKRSAVKTLATKEFLGELFAGASADCDFLILGNRISRVGVIDWLEKRADENPNWRKFEQKLILPNGTTAWSDAWVLTDAEAKDLNLKRPPREWVKSVEAKKRDLGTAIFNQEYQNEPASASEVFRPSDFRYFALSDFENGKFDKKEFEIGIAVDPAFSTKKESDDTVVAVVARNRRTREFFVLDLVAEVILPSNAVKLIFNLAERWKSAGWNVAFISVERVDLNRSQSKFSRDVESFMRENGAWFSLRHFRPRGKKEDRIKFSLSPIFENGAMYFRSDDNANDAWRKVEEQLLTFPLSEKDDCSDCLAQAVEQFERRGGAKKAEQSLVCENSGVNSGVNLPTKLPRRNVLVSAVEERRMVRLVESSVG